MPTISVIIPAYNVEKYLDKCMNSVLNQSFTDFEVLLIDDGAKDSTVQLCDKYAEKDTRVKTYHKKNGGLSDARNYGLERISGKYVTFIDSDDCSIKTLSVLDVADNVSEYLLTKWPESSDEILDLQAHTYLKNLQQILNSGNKAFLEYQNRIILFIKDNRHKLLTSNRVPLNDKAWCNLDFRGLHYTVHGRDIPYAKILCRGQN